MRRHGTTDVRAAVVSMSSRSPKGLDAAYLEWHLLDHLPEQYRIPALRCGSRWVSTPSCRAARAAAAAPFDDVDHLVAYLFAEPLAAGLDTFFALGADLREAGRMPVRLPAVELGGYTLMSALAAPAALVGADLLPWRPSRGVYVLLEDGPAPDPSPLLEVPGVAGCWRFDGTATLHERLADTSDRRLTLLYLDEDPASVASDLATVLATRWTSGAITPLLAAPFVTVVPWAWDAALPT